MRRLLARLLGLLSACWVWSLRYTRIGSPVHGPGIIAFWHGDQLALLGGRPDTELVAPISLSKDGALQALVMERFGIESVRGSSHRGAVSALRGLIRSLKRDVVCLIAVDGSRGPRREAKQGAVYLAQRQQIPIWVAGVAVAHGYRLESTWDHFLLPCPGTKTVVSIEGPWIPSREIDLQQLTADLESRLGDAQTNAEYELQAQGGGRRAIGHR